MKTLLTSILLLLLAAPAFATLSLTAANESGCSTNTYSPIAPVPPPMEADFVGNESVLPCLGTRVASQFADAVTGDGTDAVELEARFGVEATNGSRASGVTIQKGELAHAVTLNVDVPGTAAWEIAVSHSLDGVIGGLDSLGQGDSSIGDLELDGTGPGGPFSSTLPVAASVDTNGPPPGSEVVAVGVEISDADTFALTGSGDAVVDLFVSVTCRAESRFTPVTTFGGIAGDYEVCLFGLNDFGSGENPDDPYGRFERDPQGDGYRLRFELTLATVAVDVDVKPGSDPNPVNPRSRGVVPVAVLGSESFEVQDVDATTLAFGPAGAAIAHRNGPHFEDVNGDGMLDLLAHFQVAETGISHGDEAACLTGETLDGVPFKGCDSVRSVPPR